MKSKCYKVTAYNKETRVLLEFYYFLNPDTNDMESSGYSDEEFVSGLFVSLGEIKVSQIVPNGKITFTTDGKNRVDIEIDKHII